MHSYACHPILNHTGKGLVTNYGEGGLQNGRGGACFTPTKRVGGKSFSHAERGAHKVSG